MFPPKNKGSGMWEVNGGFYTVMDWGELNRIVVVYTGQTVKPVHGRVNGKYSAASILQFLRSLGAGSLVPRTHFYNKNIYKVVEKKFQHVI